MNLKFSQFYVKFRASAWFLAFLVGTCIGWLALHWLFHMDKDLGGLNIFLSFEASISLAFFAMVSEFQYHEQKKQSDAIQQILNQMVVKVDDISEDVDEIKEDVEKA